MRRPSGPSKLGVGPVKSQPILAPHEPRRVERHGRLDRERHRGARAHVAGVVGLFGDRGVFAVGKCRTAGASRPVAAFWLDVFGLRDQTARDRVAFIDLQRDRRVVSSRITRTPGERRPRAVEVDAVFRLGQGDSRRSRVHRERNRGAVADVARFVALRGLRRVRAIAQMRRLVRPFRAADRRAAVAATVPPTAAPS